VAGRIVESDGRLVLVASAFEPELLAALAGL
jgi:hypothetical protein